MTKLQMREISTASNRLIHLLNTRINRFIKLKTITDTNVSAMVDSCSSLTALRTSARCRSVEMLKNEPNIY